MSRGRPSRPGRGTRDAGSVTVELALALPAVAAVLAVALGAVQATARSTAVSAAAVAAARAAVVGPVHDAEGAARRVAGADVSVSVSEEAGWVEVIVEAPARWPWPAARAGAALPEEP